MIRANQVDITKIEHPKGIQLIKVDEKFVKERVGIFHWRSSSSWA